MFAFLSSILTRLVGPRNVGPRNAALEYITQRPVAIDEKTHKIADAVLEILVTSPDCAPELDSRLQSLVSKNGTDQDLKDNVDFSANGWTESLALAVFSGLEKALEAALKAGAPMGRAMADAYQKVVSVVTEMGMDAVGFTEDHPVYVTLLTLGILVCLAPWAMVALGFGELGPIEGSFAAWWQARFAGYVPKGSLLSFLQRLGMIWSL